MGGGGGHSNLGCCDTFLKIVSLQVQNYRSEEVKVYIFESSLHWLFKNTKIITIGATSKKL